MVSLRSSYREENVYLPITEMKYNCEIYDSLQCSTVGYNYLNVSEETTEASFSFSLPSSSAITGLTVKFNSTGVKYKGVFKDSKVGT